MSEGNASIQQLTAPNNPVTNSNSIDAKDVMLKLAENTSAIRIDITKIQGNNALVADKIGRIEADILTIKNNSLTNEKAKILIQDQLKEFKKDSLARKDFWILAAISIVSTVVSIIIKIF